MEPLNRSLPRSGIIIPVELKSSTFKSNASVENLSGFGGRGGGEGASHGFLAEGLKQDLRWDPRDPVPFVVMGSWKPYHYDNPLL